MAVYVGNACLDENGNIAGGRAGDQTGSEVRVQSWYAYNWGAVFRPIDGDKAEIAARVMAEACANDHIGYDQNERMTLYYAWVNAGRPQSLDANHITVDCETDCSALDALCNVIAGLIPEDCAGYATSSQYDILASSGNFEIYKSSSYVNSSANLMRGDTLWKYGHTALVTGGQAPSPSPSPSPSGDPNIQFTYAVRTLNHGVLPAVTNLSDYAGEDGDPIVGLTIKCDRGGLWYRVHTTEDGWLPAVTGSDFNMSTDNDDNWAGNFHVDLDGKIAFHKIDMVQVYYNTPDDIVNEYGYQQAQYRVSPIGKDYYPWQYDNDVDPQQDGYAGDFGEYIDRFQLF